MDSTEGKIDLVNISDLSFFRGKWIMRYILLLFLFFQLVFTQADLKPQKYTSKKPETYFTHCSFKETIPFNRKNIILQSPKWFHEMKTFGERMLLAKVRSVYFVHGTFAGNDPVGIISCIKAVYPKLSKTTEDQLRKLLKNNNNKLLADTGNYLPEYVQLFQKALGNKIPSQLFQWSSRNNHIARLRGSIKLIQHISKDLRKQPALHGERILLIGHSHAGQLFALLTNFLANSKGIEKLFEVAQYDGIDIFALQRDIENIKQVKFDIATFGTPPRYGWGKADYRLINIINHREKDHLGGKIYGLLTTKSGDYVQQWGIQGTDLIASTSQDRELNKELSLVLGKGNDLGAWTINIKPRMRVPAYGRTFLVDYKDSSFILPNFMSSFFGHGVYTKYETLLFNTKLIVSEFY